MPPPVSLAASRRVRARCPKDLNQVEGRSVIYSLGERKVEALGDYFVASNAVVVGSVILGNNANVWFNCVVRADNDVIRIGENCNVQDGSILHVDEGVPLTLHRNASVGHMAMLHGCTVGENSLIGINAIVLNHAVIGANCLIGANALIPEGKEIPDGSLVVGSPGRVVRSLTAGEQRELGEISTHYVENALRYRESLREMHPGR